MLDVYAHVLAHELVHCLTKACCSFEAQKLIDSAGQHSQVFQYLSENIFGHMHCEGLGAGWADSLRPVTVEEAWRTHFDCRSKTFGA